MPNKKQRDGPKAKESQGGDVPALPAPVDPSSTMRLREEPLLLLLLLFYKSTQNLPQTLGSAL